MNYKFIKINTLQSQHVKFTLLVRGCRAAILSFSFNSIMAPQGQGGFRTFPFPHKSCVDKMQQKLS